MFALRHVATGMLLNLYIDSEIGYEPYDTTPRAMVDVMAAVPPNADYNNDIFVQHNRGDLEQLLKNGKILFADRDLKLSADLRVPGVVEIVELKVV